MKKMIGFGAVALCAAVACADVTSANIVGYMQNELTNGYSVIVSPFVGVGGGKINIDDLVPVDSTGKTVGNATFNLQGKLPGGAAGKVYVYLHEGDDDNDHDGWFESDWVTPAQKEFATGEAMLFNSGVVGGTLTYKGQVLTGPAKLPLANGYSLVGNPFPVPVNIDNIIPVDAQGKTVGNATFNLQGKQKNGDAGKVYVYLHEGDDDNDHDGWFESDWVTPAKKVFQPGEGFIFNSSVTDGKLTFPTLDL